MCIVLHYITSSEDSRISDELSLAFDSLSIVRAGWPLSLHSPLSALQLCSPALAWSAGQPRSSVSSGPHLSSPPAIHSSGKVWMVRYSESTVTMCQFATMFAIPCSLTAGLNSLFYDKPIISNWDQDCGRDKQVASYSSGSCAGRVTVAAGVQTMLCGFVSNVEVVF